MDLKYKIFIRRPMEMLEVRIEKGKIIEEPKYVINSRTGIGSEKQNILFMGKVLGSSANY